MTDDADKQMLEYYQQLNRELEQLDHAMADLQTATRAYYRSMDSQLDEIIQQLRSIVPEGRS